MQNSFGKLANLFGNCNIHFYYGKMRLLLLETVSDSQQSLGHTERTGS